MTDAEHAADIGSSDELLRTIVAVLNIRAVFPQVCGRGSTRDVCSSESTLTQALLNLQMLTAGATGKVLPWSRRLAT